MLCSVLTTVESVDAACHFFHVLYMCVSLPAQAVAGIVTKHIY